MPATGGVPGRTPKRHLRLNEGYLVVNTLKIATAAGFLVVAMAGAAWAQDTSGAMTPATPAPDPAQAVGAPSSKAAPSADTSGANSSATASAQDTTVTNGPVPDTADNRAKYGAPMSHAGKKTKPAGN